MRIEKDKLDETDENVEKRFKLSSTNDFYLGQKLDVLDSVNRWSEAEVVKINNQPFKIFISYLYWDYKWDEWIHESEFLTRIAPLHFHTYFKGGTLKLGQRIEVRDLSGKWIESFVIDEEFDCVKIHYRNYATHFDEWILRGSDRIRCYKKNINKMNNKLWPVPGKEDNHSSSASQGITRTRQISEVSEQFLHYTRALGSHNLFIFKITGDGNW